MPKNFFLQISLKFVFLTDRANKGVWRTNVSSDSACDSASFSPTLLCVL